MPRAYRHHLVVEARETALIFGDQRRIKACLPIPQLVRRQLAAVGDHRRPTIVIAAVAALIIALEMLIDFRVRRPFDQRHLQRVQRTAGIKRRLASPSPLNQTSPLREYLNDSIRRENALDDPLALPRSRMRRPRMPFPPLRCREPDLSLKREAVSSYFDIAPFARRSFGFHQALCERRRSEICNRAHHVATAATCPIRLSTP
jgi:hypothetical protein